ncbi:hypothetical protein BDV26DRAFT_267727 [Aspergillus bertholletiae]|uniref:Uncharacterized protein n=1 Tax=Aspergillus bertholletiae TaxID=1226010 RepID=A0A5N7B0D5_9EURO|nr:hypothetical protein BDV26DRAFT_267727 [Aspergillus bertholletiae]
MLIKLILVPLVLSNDGMGVGGCGIEFFRNVAWEHEVPLDRKAYPPVSVSHDRTGSHFNLMLNNYNAGVQMPEE